MEEIKSKLKKQAEMLHDTIGWWKAEMLKVMSECSEMPSIERRMGEQRTPVFSK